MITHDEAGDEAGVEDSAFRKEDEGRKAAKNIGRGGEIVDFDTASIASTMAASSVR